MPTKSLLILSSFQRALTVLHDHLLLMSDLAQTGLQRAMEGLLQRDNNICARVIADDEEIALLGSEIDREGVGLLVCYHPVASDLRRVVAGMKLSLALRRVAEQAVDIAWRARELNEHPPMPEIQLIEEMHAYAAVMVRESVECFMSEDVELALTLKPRDRALDQMAAFTSEKLIERMALHPEQLRNFLNLLFVGRHLERVGDYATNMAEDAVYAAAAEDIRHQSTQKPNRLEIFFSSP